MPPRYEDFFLTVYGSPGNYTVAADGPGQIRVSAPFNFSETSEIRSVIERIKIGEAPRRPEMQGVGAALFDALFPRAIARAFDSAQATLTPDVRLRLKLVVWPPEVADLPWELLYDTDANFFLAGRLTFPLVRFIEAGQPVASLLARRPLRVLYVQANPRGTDRLALGSGERAIREALPEGTVITALRNATTEALRDALRERPGYHILHYDGHAAFDATTNDGFLALTNNAGGIHRLTGERLANHLDGSTIRLVVLAACETGMESRQQRFTGIAQRLMHTSSLPAVIANQWKAFDDSTLAFIRGFYQALADDYPVDAAVIEGRRAILDLDIPNAATGFDAADWAAPVLFMRSPDGDILREELPTEDGKMDEQNGGKDGRSVNTGGGAYIGGGVHTGGGDFVGRDKIQGGQFNVGTISGGVNAFGENARATSSTGGSGADLHALFADIYRQIEHRPADPNVDKSEVTDTVKRIEGEAAKGEQANTNGIGRWLKTLAEIAPDIVKITAAVLANPVTGTAEAVKLIAAQFK